jgi:Thioredoxin
MHATGALDATEHESLAQRYGIKGFPTIKVFGSDKQSPTDYMGERTAEAIVAEGLRLFEVCAWMHHVCMCRINLLNSVRSMYTSTARTP